MFLNICRLCCKSEDALIHVYDQSQDDELSNKILVCFGVDIKEDDQVTKEICRTCYFFTNSYYEYRKTCLQNNQKILEEFEQSQHPIQTLDHVTVTKESVNLPSDTNVIPSTSVNNGYSNKTSTAIAKATQNTNIFKETQQLSQNAFLNSLNLSNRKNTGSQSKIHKSITKIKNKFPKIILPLNIRNKDLDPFVRIYPIKESVRIDKLDLLSSAHNNESSCAKMPKQNCLLKRLNLPADAITTLFESPEMNQSRFPRRVRKSISYDYYSSESSTPEKINNNYNNKRVSSESVDRDEPKLKKPCFVSLTRIESDSSVVKLTNETYTKIDDTNESPRQTNLVQENLLIAGDELPTFVCQICNKLFDTEYLFKTHKRKMHKSSLRCTQCPKRFKVVEQLMEHLQMHLTVVNQKMNTFARKRTGGGTNLSKLNPARTNELLQGPTSPPSANDELENNTRQDVLLSASNENTVNFENVEIIPLTPKTNDQDTPSIPPGSDTNEILELKIFQDLEPEVKEDIQLIVDSDDDDVVFVATVANEEKQILEHPVELSTEPKQYFIEHEPVTGGPLLDEENFIKYVFDKCRTNDDTKRRLINKKWRLQDLPRWNRRTYVPLEITGCKENKFEVNYSKFTAPNNERLQLWDHDDIINVPKKMRAAPVQIAKQRYCPTFTSTNTNVSSTESVLYTMAEINLPENETDIESTLTQNLIIPRESLMELSDPNAASSLKPISYNDIPTSSSTNNNDANKINIVVVPHSKPSSSTTSSSPNQTATALINHINTKHKLVINKGGPQNQMQRVSSPTKVYAPAKGPAATSLLKTNNPTITSQPLVVYQMTSNQPSKNNPVQLVYQVANTSVPETTSNLTKVNNSTAVFRPNALNSNFIPFNDLSTLRLPNKSTQHPPNCQPPPSILKTAPTYRPAPKILNQTLTYQPHPNLTKPYLTYTVPYSIPKICTTYTIPDSTSKVSTTYTVPISTPNVPNSYANQFKNTINSGIVRQQYMQSKQTPDASADKAPLILNQLLSSPCAVITNNLKTATVTTTPTTIAPTASISSRDPRIKPTIRIKSLSELTLPTNPRDQLHENYTETLSKYVTDNPNPVNNSTYRSTNDEYLQIS